ncbi:DUF4240 domain-containing protein [Spirilliplanes yamanashiensis]|uniref:DUF4240 domain-containing protein n=1 Tax=Spirilliplanes yamanashiensis TaxID=42233 RepID=A0A8J3YE22_9ACTN|nr:DUF4240 domain-containing protein [Spirilliplanes yamanashiensis]MDP9816498.1 hypothetical protein [Spirilliplanes yamanashiensis]GIJ06025.1 hypothetical protein Sya03_53770 [Spirilliplanes yamanashiensis]
MRTEEFWAIVDRARAGASQPAVVAQRAVDELAARDPGEIVAWGRHLDKVMAASYAEDLWAAAYLINGGCSDDDYDHFRGWLVAHGRDVFARAVRQPDSLADLPAVRAAVDSGAEFAGQEVLAVAADAYRAATGEDLPPGEPPGPRPSQDDFWDFDNEDEMHRRLPRLAALFLEPPEE